MKNKQNIKNITALILLAVAAAVAVIFAFAKPELNADRLKNELINGIIMRAVLGGIFCAVIILLGDGKYFVPDVKNFGRNVIWCVPCILVVLANFPFSALITGAATVTRSDAAALFAVNCVCIGVMEEALFRGMLQPVVNSLFSSKKYENLLTVAVTSAVFALSHLFNLLSGAGAGETFLQVGYCFLTGAMFSAVLIKTGSLWFPILLHTVFDIGGNLIPQLGTGQFQDATFWILTAVAGIICFAHVLYFLIKGNTSVNRNV